MSLTWLEMAGVKCLSCSQQRDSSGGDIWIPLCTKVKLHSEETVYLNSDEEEFSPSSHHAVCGLTESVIWPKILCFLGATLLLFSVLCSIIWMLYFRK